MHKGGGIIARSYSNIKGHPLDNVKLTVRYM